MIGWAAGLAGWALLARAVVVIHRVLREHDQDLHDDRRDINALAARVEAAEWR